MTVATRTKFPTSTIFVGGLSLVAGVTLFIFTKWLVFEVQNPSDKIAGVGLALTIVTTSAGAIVTLLRESKTEAKNSEKTAEELFWERIKIIKLSGVVDEGVLTDRDLISLMPPQLQNKKELYLKESRNFENYLDICQGVANHLVTNQKQLQKIAKAGADDILKDLRSEELKRLGLEDEASREIFYTDIYLYLKVWLTLSIEYLQPMPVSRIKLSIPNRNLYVSTLSYIKDKGLGWFHLPDKESEEVFVEYFDTLISKLQNYQD